MGGTVLTINFGVPDLARTRFAISPMEHVLTALAGAHDCVGARRARWWRRMRRHVPQTAAPLLELVNASRTNIPNFLVASALGTHRRLADELDWILATTPADLQQALTGYEAVPDLPRIVVELRDGDTRRLQRITDGARALFEACLAPDWPDIRSHLQADIAHRAQTTGEAGCGAVLAGLHPHAVWREEGVLQCAVGGRDRSFDLGGQGLELHPNFFVQNGLAAVLVPRRPSVLLHPTAARPADHADATTDRLAGLIGPARARALRAVGQQPCSTTQLAERLGITPPSASYHATALRTAGAITTRRQGRQVQHVVTALGHVLLLGHQVAVSR